MNWLILNRVLIACGLEARADHGKPMFQRLKKTTKLKLTRTRTFKNGNVMLVYEPEKR